MKLLLRAAIAAASIASIGPAVGAEPGRLGAGAVPAGLQVAVIPPPAQVSA